MKCYLFIIFYELFLPLNATKPNSDNLELQTVLEFNLNHNSGDLRKVDKSRDFLKVLKKDIPMKKYGLESEHEDKVEEGGKRHADDVKHYKNTSGINIKHKPKTVHIDGPYKFTDFIKDTFEILTTYNDESLIEVVSAMADEINRLSMNFSNVHKLLDAPQFRRIISQNLESLNHASAQDIRNELNTIVYMIEMDLFNDRQKDFFNIMNSVHRKELEAHFKNLINNLRQYGRESKRANLSLTDIIRNGITSLFSSTQKPVIIKALRKAFNNPSIVSDDELTIETADYKNKPSVLFQNTTDRDVLSRLTNLEKELDNVKKQISEISVKRKHTGRDDSSIESEYVKSEMEDKATKTVVTETTTSKVTTLDFKDEHNFRALDDEFDNELNNSIENKEIRSKSNDTFNRIDGNNTKLEDKLKITTVIYAKISEEIKENRQDFKNSMFYKNIMAEKRNNEEDKIILAAALKKMQKESEVRLELDKNKKHNNTTKHKLPEMSDLDYIT